jgi:hypothetical protein
VAKLYLGRTARPPKKIPAILQRGLAMLSILSGLVAVGASGAGLWYFKPRGGAVHPLVVKPFFDSFIAIAIMSVFAVGVALILDGLY